MKHIGGYALLFTLGLNTQMAAGAKRPPSPDFQIVPASALPAQTLFSTSLSLRRFVWWPL
jgi:hypothetical protein